uniref:NADH dehydrogenase subunit 2 n=1 Tax=Tympanophyllum maximum TaxID=3039643 RepID=UPI002551FE23|nr:NADH dehydrogenase subunit 2 [Tympanophyllum maximum]WFP43215.1 NADH dehydrogenase subunit 2 [Tympanophyllum maximum]
MIFNPSKYLFSLTLIMGTLISMSSTSWLGAWIGLEINLLAFIPLITSCQNPLSTEASLKYFLIQAFASSTLLFSFILMQFMTKINMLFYQELLPTLMTSSLLLKMGAAPFHFWFPGTMEGLSWSNALVLMTWQKIAPLILLSYLINFNMFIYAIIITSITIGCLGGLNQTSLRKLIAYSSISHLGWMLSGMLIGENLWTLYFIIYCMLSAATILVFYTFQISYLPQNYLLYNSNPTMKFSMYSLLLSLGGLPPFIGFLPKWLVIQAMIYSDHYFLTTLMVITTLVTLFYYIRLTFSAFLLNSPNLKWNMLPMYSSLLLTTISSSVLLSMIGLMMMTTIWSIH